MIISKHDKQTDHLSLACPANFVYRTSPIPCVKTYARPREDPAAGGGGVDPIAAILWRRASSPGAGEKLGFEAKEAGIMVARRRQEGKIREGERPERKTRKPTDKNGAAKRGQTAEEDKKQKMEDFVATAGVVPRLLVRKNFALSLQVSAGGVYRL